MSIAGRGLGAGPGRSSAVAPALGLGAILWRGVARSEWDPRYRDPLNCHSRALGPRCARFPDTRTPLTTPRHWNTPAPACLVPVAPCSPFPGHPASPRPHMPLFPSPWEPLDPHSCLSQPPYPLFPQYQGPSGPTFQPSLLSPAWDPHFLDTGGPCAHLSLTLASPNPLSGFPSFP